MHRSLVLTLALALAGCESMAPGDEKALPLHLENAAQYYDTGHYLRAYQQWDRALELEPGNEKARLGQAMALYQMGLEDSPEGVQRLQLAEERLDELRREGLGGQQWKAELGFALVEQRWVDLLDRKARKLETDPQGGADDRAALELVRRERADRIARAEASFKAVLRDRGGEPTDELTAWLGLARLTALRGDLDASLAWAKRFEDQVVRSKALWDEAARRFPREASVYESKLLGAELQEAELRDLLGNVLFKLGRLDEARAELDQLVALQPERSDAFLNRGIVRQAQGDWDLARSDFRKFLALTELPSSHPTVLEATKRLLESEDRLAHEDDLGAGLPPADGE